MYNMGEILKMISIKFKGLTKAGEGLKRITVERFFVDVTAFLCWTAGALGASEKHRGIL